MSTPFMAEDLQFSEDTVGSWGPKQYPPRVEGTFFTYSITNPPRNPTAGITFPITGDEPQVQKG